MEPLARTHTLAVSFCLGFETQVCFGHTPVGLRENILVSLPRQMRVWPNRFSVLAGHMYELANTIFNSYLGGGYMLITSFKVI